MSKKIVHLRQNLLEWYRINKRDLPWRYSTDPYIIWVSEIILQQTQVITGLSYFERFVDKYPDVQSLARAPEEDILRLWQGLGYYSRARNMQFAARQVMDNFNGNFPDKFETILSLKGIGDYTASAIASIAYNLPFAVVDGNVIRVVSRLFGITAPVDTAASLDEIKRHSKSLLDKEHPGDYNQAIMEYGALFCKPQNPDCESCCLKAECVAFKKGQVKEIPQKKKKIKVRSRYFDYLVIEEGACVYLQKRSAGDIWQGLFEYPLIEGSLKQKPKSLKSEIASMLECNNDEIIECNKLWGPKKHVLSHQHIYASFYQVRLSDSVTRKSNWLKVNAKDVDSYPVARITELFREKK